MLVGAVVVLAGLGLLIYALIDCVQAAPLDVRSAPKPAWIGIVLLVPFAGPLAWLMAGRPHRGRHQRGPRPEVAARPLGPDDDPEFLALLRDRQRRPGPPADPEPGAP